MKPKHYMMVCGQGRSKYPLAAFDEALRAAGVGDYNLVKVSSILPPNCKREKEIDIQKGSILYAAYAMTVLADGEHNMVAVGVAVPKDKQKNGVIFETTNPSAAHDVDQMCREAMNKRGRKVRNVYVTASSAVGEPGMYTAIFAGLVMW